jgi:hypothetical protein
MAADHARILIRPAAIADVYALAATLRPGDRAEIAAIGRDPRTVLRASFRSSLTPVKVALFDGQIAAMWGLGGDILSDTGWPWLMTAPPIERIAVSFLKIAKAEVAAMLAFKPRLEGHVDARYAKAVRLLEVLGFAIDPPMPVGPGRALFRPFSIERAP